MRKESETMESYKTLLRDVMTNGEAHEDRTGVGTQSVFGRQWRHDMREGFPLLTTKRVTLRWVFEELRWFLNGHTDEEELSKHGVDIWKEWATAEQCAKFGRGAGDLGPIYGFQWRRFGGSAGTSSYDDITGIDQIRQLLRDIVENPSSRRMIVTAWNPRDVSRVTLPPCHTLWQVKCHEGADGGEMSLHMYARSIDIFLGLPYNIASYGLLLEMLCAVTGRRARELVISFGDLHLYRNHVDQASVQLMREPRALCNVKVNMNETEDRRECGDKLDRLLGITWKDIEVVDYDSWPPLRAEVAV